MLAMRRESDQFYGHSNSNSSSNNNSNSAIGNSSSSYNSGYHQQGTFIGNFFF